MAIKIPEAPNIVGSDIELRSPQMVSPVSNTPQFKVDFSGLQESVGDVAKYYQGMVRDQTNTYMTAGKNEYLQHMRSYQDRIFEDHQGSQAKDLYARFIKPESDRWLEEKYGEPKDDGQIRIVDKELQKQFTNWVSTQQPHFINNTANYEQREWDKYRNSVFTAQDNIAANLILNATSPETIQNGINAFRQNTYDANPGMDKDFIEQAVSAKVDASIVGHLNQVAMTEPLLALQQMNTYKPIVENLTDASKKQVMETIRKCYDNLGIDDYAHAKIGDGGNIGYAANTTWLEQVYGKDWKEAQARIISKGKERAEALKKTQAGQHDDIINLATDKILNARNNIEFSEGIRDLYAADPESANAYLKAHDSFVANQQDLLTLGDSYYERVEKVDERLQGIGEDIMRSKLRKTLDEEPAGIMSTPFGLGAIADAARVVGEKLGITEKGSTRKAEVEEALNRQPKGAWRKEITAADLNNIVDDIVADEGEWNRDKVEAAVRVWDTSNRRQDQMPQYKELAAKISNGEIRAYDVSSMGELDYPIQQSLMALIKNNNDFVDTKNDLKSTGVDLDKVMQSNGIDAQYNNLDVASQNLLKRNIVYEVNAYKARNNGMLPDADVVNGIALRVQKNSVSPMMALLQDTVLAENMASENLTEAQRLELGVRESLKWEYNKPSKRGLTDQLGRAESTIDRLSNSSRLNRDERQYIKQNKAYLTTLLQAGDLAGMVNFMALATQGGF